MLHYNIVVNEKNYIKPNLSFRTFAHDGKYPKLLYHSPYRPR